MKTLKKKANFMKKEQVLIGLGVTAIVTAFAATGVQADEVTNKQSIKTTVSRSGDQRMLKFQNQM